MGLVSGACQQLANFKQKQQRRRLLSSNGCVGGGGATMTGAAAERSKQRESMLNVTKSASTAVPVSTTLIGGVANTAAQVLSDPCEATSSARSAGVNLIAGLVNTAGSADNDVTLSAEGSANLLGALSAAVTPAEDGDENAAGASAAATGTARAMMTTQLGPALPGEKPASVNTPMMSYVAARVAPPTNDTTGGGTSNNATTGASAADAAPSASAGGAAAKKTKTGTFLTSTGEDGDGLSSSISRNREETEVFQAPKPPSSPMRSRTGRRDASPLVRKRRARKKKGGKISSASASASSAALISTHDAYFKLSALSEHLHPELQRSLTPKKRRGNRSKKSN